MRVEWLEQPTLDDLAPAAALLTEWQREVLGDDEPPMPPEQLVEEVVETPPHREGSILIALDDGDLVGVATLLCDDLQGRQQEAETQALVVAADHRGRGIGRRLLETVAQRCRERGRDRLVGYSPLTDRASTAFAERLRAERGIVDQQNRAAVEDIDRDLLERWVARASERAAAYSLVRFDGVCPDDLLVPLTTISLSMNTAPRRESREDIVPSPEQIRERQEAMRKNGQEFWTVAARHDASGELAGFTELGFPPYLTWLAWQGDTGVDPAHRTRGLGRWLKAVNALRLLDEKPAVTHIETWNADVNAPMLSINRAMGFRTVARYQEWELLL